jgi:hypothetical protein
MHNPDACMRKLLVCMLAVIISFIPPNICAGSDCDSDGICEPGETRDNCPWDCLINTSLRTDQSNHQWTYYNITKGIQRHRDGTDTTYDGSKEGPNCKALVDWAAARHQIITVGATAGNLVDPESACWADRKRAASAVLYYFDVYQNRIENLNSRAEYPYLYPLGQRILNDEGTFVHQAGAPPVPDNRILIRAADNKSTLFLMNLADRNLRTVLAAYWSNYLLYHRVIKTFHGMFWDELESGPQRFETTTFKRKITGEASTVAVSGGVRTIAVSSPMSTGTNLDIPVVVNAANGFIRYPVKRFADRTITIAGAAAPGTPVRVTYYTTSVTLPEDVKNPAYAISAVHFLGTFKNAVGNARLSIANSAKRLDLDSSWEAYMAELDGVMYEGWVSGRESSEAEWKAKIDVLARWSPTKIMLCQSTGLNDTRKAAFDATVKYCYASYLLGRGKYGYWGFTVSTGRKLYYYDYFDYRLGRPLGPYRVRAVYGGCTVYEREYEHVMVIVNPNASKSAAIDLGATYARVDDLRVVSSVNLGPRSAEILSRR